MFKITTRQNLLSEYIFLEINYFNSKLTGSIIHCFHQFNENQKVSLTASYPMLKSEDVLSTKFFFIKFPTSLLLREAQLRSATNTHFISVWPFNFQLSKLELLKAVIKILVQLAFLLLPCVELDM